MARALKLRNAVAITALASIWLAMLSLGQGPLDRSIYEFLYAGGHPLFIAIAGIFTELGEPTVLVTAAFLLGIWLWLRGKRRLAGILLFVILIGRGLSEVQKYWIDRARPDFEPHLVIVKTPSFPSGHATSSMIFYLTIAFVLVP